MSSAASLAPDTLSSLASAETQRAAGRLAQDVFAGVFRQAFTPDPEQLGKALGALERNCLEWSQAGAGDDERLLRLALLITGLDQWGLAYTQAFGLNAIPALSALIVALRSRLNAQSEARFQQFFAQVEAVETDAVDFKMEVRRGIHLALWHAMAACEAAAEAQELLQSLGGMLLALDRQMPQIGWRLVADALAHIQVSLLADPDAMPELAKDNTQRLFAALRQALPAERYQDIVRHSGQVLLAWQQLKRNKEAR